MTGLVVEHRESLFSRRLRRRRAQIAVGIAAVEAVLVAAGHRPLVGGGRRRDRVRRCLRVEPAGGNCLRAVRTATWLAAVSQLIVVLVPVGIALVGLLALVGVVVLAVVALTVILLDRR